MGGPKSEFWKPPTTDFKCFSSLAQYLVQTYPDLSGAEVIVVYENGWGIPERLLNDYDMREALQMCDMCAKTMVVYIFPSPQECAAWHIAHIEDNALRYETYPSQCLISGIKDPKFKNPAELINHIQECLKIL